MKRISLLFVLVLALSAIATANIIPNYNGTTGSTPTFTWSYHFDLSADQNAVSGVVPPSTPTQSQNMTFSGSYVTIYDFAGYIAGSCSGPSGWTCVSQNIGFTPDTINPIPADNAGVANITWVYTGGGTNPATLAGPLNLGTFTANSTISKSQVVGYASRGIGKTSGTVANNWGDTVGPSPVPEPATMALIGAGLIGLGLLRRRARKS